LLGLLAEKGCVAQKALKSLGVSSRKVREELAAQNRLHSAGEE
jgi:hypothetical protein